MARCPAHWPFISFPGVISLPRYCYSSTSSIISLSITISTLGFILPASLNMILIVHFHSILSSFFVQFLQNLCQLFLPNDIISKSQVGQLFSTDVDVNIYIHSSKYLFKAATKNIQCIKKCPRTTALLQIRNHG